jgi:hypothetical protein
MPLQATSGAASYDAFGGGAAAVPNYIEEVFSTFLYTAAGTSRTINNGIDLSGKGGLVWRKQRDAANSHSLNDSARGTTQTLNSNTTSAQFSGLNLSFLSTGFTINGNDGDSGATFVTWTFREQPKFFDVVTWTGNGTARTISHNLGSAPGCLIVKRTDGTGDWWVWHRSFVTAGSLDYINLNLDFGKAAGGGLPLWDNTVPTATVFSLSSRPEVNSNGATYVAYLFAHDAGGFGLTGTDNVISCGSFTTDGSGDATVNLGYEPQWVLMKVTNDSQNWILNDTMRGMPTKQIPDAGGNCRNLFPNTSGAESVTGRDTSPTSTGFIARVGSASKTYIYIAIRRGPMKVPTTGTSVYSPQTATGVQTTNFVVDAFIGVNNRASPGSFDPFEKSRLQGGVPYLTTSSTAAEGSGSDVGFDSNTGVKLSWGAGGVNWYFQRAPGFFDVVCYFQENNTNQRVTHNLSVVPELIIVKIRNAGGEWYVYNQTLGRNQYITLNNDQRAFTFSNSWGTSNPTSTDFGTSSSLISQGYNYVAYLFATCPGVSKVGSYTGTGTTQVINCGFTAGSRFVLIKRTDALAGTTNGGWHVWDSARGIVAGNDPYLLLNSTADEVTSTDYIDTASTGFEISSTAPAAINASGGTFIFLAIA